MGDEEGWIGGVVGEGSGIGEGGMEGEEGW